MDGMTEKAPAPFVSVSVNSGDAALVSFLERNNLLEIMDILKKNGVCDMATLKIMSEKDLGEMGMSMGLRKKVSFALQNDSAKSVI